MAGSDVTLGGAGSDADLAYTPHVSSLVISTMAIVCLELVIPLTVLQVYDRVVPNEGTSTLPVLVTGAAFFLLLDMILRAARAHIIGMNGAISGHRIARRAMEKIVISDVQTASSRKVAENLSILGSVRSLKYSYDGQTLVTLIELGFGPLALLLIAIVAGPLVIVPIVAIALFSLVTLLNGRKLVDCIDKRSATDDRRFDYLIDILKAAQSIKSLAMEGRIIRRYEHFKYRSCVDNFHFSQSVTMVFDTAAGFATLLTLCMIICGSYMVVQGWITTGAMIASMILAGRIILPLQRGLSLYVRSQAIRLERRNAQTFLQNSYVSRIVDEATDNLEVGNDGALRFENVTVSRDRGGCALSGADTVLKPFEYYVLDGFNRDEATGFFRLCAGLNRPQEGRVLLNSKEMENLSDATRSRCLAYLQSRAVIYRGTVMENLSRFGATSLADVLYVSRLINLEEEISGLPQGLDTHLRGDMSDPLDPGLKQRIALVRQLAPRPRMILFDNADMGLDRRTYTAVYDLLARLSGKATIIMSTGDANLRNLATRKLEIVDGKLIDSEVSSEFNLRVTKYRELRI